MMKALALCVATLCATLCTACSKSDSGDATAPAAPNVPLGTASVGTLVERVDAQGRVGPPAGSTTKLAFPQAGTLATLDVAVGDTVRAGEALAELDRAPLAAPLAQARADAISAAASYGDGAVPAAALRGATAKLAVATARLDALERGGPSASNGRIEAAAVARQAALKVDADRLALARQTELFTAGVVARKDVDAAREQLATDRADQTAADAKGAAASNDYAAALAQARADVASATADRRTAAAQTGVLQGGAQSARARVDAARVAYDNGVLYAPSDGVVLAELKRPGESVDPASPVLEIGPSSGHDVTLTVPAVTADRIVAGDDVAYAPATSGARPTHGRVVSIVPVVDRATQVSTIVASGVPPGAVEGDALAASIAVGSVSGILVPTSAIVEDPQTGKTVVFVHVDRPKRGDSPFSMREVSIGSSDATQTIVSRGLRIGERYARSGGYMLLAPAGG